jgi:hypothetical protein
LRETGDTAGLDKGATVYGAQFEAFGHLFLPEGFSMSDLASAT